MASPGNQLCANCIGTLSFAMLHTTRVNNDCIVPYYMLSSSLFQCVNKVVLLLVRRIYFSKRYNTNIICER